MISPSQLSFTTGMVATVRNRLLGALLPDNLDLIAPHLTETALDAGILLHDSGQPITRVYFPCSGLVSLVGMLPDGHAIDTLTIGREGAVGLGAAVGSTIALNRAVVQLPGRALHISAARLAEIADRSKSLRAAIARYSDALTAQIQQTVVCNTVHPIQARLCRWLLQAHDRTGSDTLDLTQESLSGILGVQRTTITLVSRVLQADGILHVRRGHIQVRDVAALERRACSCYRVGRRLNEQIGRDSGRFAGLHALRNGVEVDAPGKPPTCSAGAS